MATYNGERFVEEQVRSILDQLALGDEVVIVDDASSDSTVAIIQSIGDPRVHLSVHSTNVGYTATFEEALSLASGAYIFLSDQDDVWVPGRVDAMLDALCASQLVVGNCKHFGGELTPFLRLRLRSSESSHYVRNLIGILVGYRLHWGSAMGIRAEFRRIALPFPKGTVESHDQWLALAANVLRDVSYLDEDVVLHRLHGGNVTPNGVRGIRAIARARWQFGKDLIVAIRRARKLRAVNGAR
jgi:glycosyltransferase involved in cell wall biosynthesis